MKRSQGARDADLVGYWGEGRGNCELLKTEGLVIYWGCWEAPVIIPDRRKCDKLMDILREAREH